ncbi:Receptor-type tyrosine-protein phosphatase S [Anabarilius grahami]|uniref:Receptor-type tyrosine-protein phosphatase S n=1 Tax=Anabarilius grahami TaxID=495550 RepID=A0A3N0Z934_ANAGA|nr:Receptor-type tyrosine-protein phosphatase S [Anabarilius grahami]
MLVLIERCQNTQSISMLRMGLHSRRPVRVPMLTPVHFRSMEAPPRNLQDLKDLLLTSWCQIPQHTFRVPGPPFLSVNQNSETTALVRWQPPDFIAPGLEVQGYRLQFGRKDVSPLATLEFSPQELEYSISNIHRGATYVFKVSAKSRSGFGEEATRELRVPEEVPRGYPQITEGSNITCCSLQFSWLPPVLAERNGAITEYTLAYQEAGTAGGPKELRLPASEKSYTLNSLRPNAVYDVKIRAHTSVGPGPYSPPIQYRTVAYKADVPKNFTVKLVTKTTVLLTWKFFDSRFPYRCMIEYNRQKVDIDARMTKTLITNLRPNVTYEFRITCQESNDGGPKHKLIARTSPPILVRKPELDLKREPDSTLTIVFPPLENKDLIKVIYVAVVPLKKGRGPIRHIKNPDELDLEELLGDKRLGQRQLKQVDGKRPYIAASFKPSSMPPSFTLGDQRVHSGFENRALDPGQEYVFFILAELNTTGGKSFASSPYTDPITAPDVDPQPVETGGDGLIWVVGPVLAVVFIICIVIAILLYKNSKRKESEPRTKCMLNNAEITPHHPTDPVEMRRINFQTPGMMNHPPIPISELAEHTELLKANDNLKLSQEYEEQDFYLVVNVYLSCFVKDSHFFPTRQFPLVLVLRGLTQPRFLNVELSSVSPPSSDVLADVNSLSSHISIHASDAEGLGKALRVVSFRTFSPQSIDPGQQFTWEHSNLEVNKPKNRYANVIAYDHSRVILAPIEGITGSDYINANYIDGYRKQNAYIATQGPLPETFGDFWRMVWEQRAATVVMMTRLEEKSRIKCDQYWPSRGTETYGMIQVTLLDTIELATFCVRTFSLHKNGSSEKREVRQFQFTAWPDHGVPEYPTPFLAFLRRVKTCNPPDAGPIIAHCSAGVGRTGCFIVIDAMLERIKHEKTVDIYGHVTLMRSQRNYMVQTEDQYSFIHDALLEAVACGNTEVAARSLFSYIQKLAQVETGEHVSGMELEFKRLANSKAHTSRFISANLPCNKFKNRLVNIMPYETTRVCLQPIRGLEGSDYINSSFIDGYRQQKAYIATQGPLAETTEDFWRMLWENNSTIVVMLTKLREMGREKCHQYWPAERSARYQYFVVDPMAEYNMPQYILREFKVTDARDGQSRTVRQFQFTDWPEQGVPKSGEGFIDFIGQVHKTKEQFGQDGPISVHCSAGVGRTGVFITLSIVLERMRYEGVVDIFQTVKMLRTQRPAMVQTEDEYQFCYQAALEYLGSFDHYAT